MCKQNANGRVPGHKFCETWNGVSWSDGSVHKTCPPKLRFSYEYNPEHNPDRLTSAELRELRSKYPNLDFSDRTPSTAAIRVLRENGINDYPKFLEKASRFTDIRLTKKQKQIGEILGILDFSDFAGSVAATTDENDINLNYSRSRKEVVFEFPDLTKTEMVLKAINQGQCCPFHGGRLDGFYIVNNRGPFPLKPVQAHFPSKAAAKDANISLTKDNIYVSCKPCNDIMSDLFGVNTPIEEVKKVIAEKVKRRNIEYLEPNQVKAIEKTITVTAYERIK